MSGRGKFITVEGIEGVGKSSNIDVIVRTLAENGIDCVTTREPGGTPLSEEIRKLLLDAKQRSMDPVTELLLMFAARVQHVKAFIEPNLASGTWVVCDRFTDSSYAYQGGGRGIDMALIAGLESTSLGNFTPDLTIVLDVPVATGNTRARQRGDRDRFEQEDETFFERVRQTFLDRAKTNPRYRIVDASAELSVVGERVAGIVKELL